MQPRFRPGEIVRVLRPSSDPEGSGSEGLVEAIAGPNEDGTGWCVNVRLAEQAGADELLLFAECDLETTGTGENERYERIILDEPPDRDGLRTCLELRLFTEITDGIEAARVAETIERELVDLLGGATVDIEAERHWAEPYNYELGVTVHPLDSPVEALRLLVEAGEPGWIACRDDGWRCELVWSGTADVDAVLIVPEVHAAEVAFLPWSSPARRPESERPLVAAAIADPADAELDEPGAEAEEELDE